MSTMDLPLFALVESYHTRGSLTTARERAHGERKAREQEERVLRYFRANPKAWGPSEVHEAAFAKSVPLTSVRRAMTNLSDEDLHPDGPPLVKTSDTRPGSFGRREHLWRLA